MSKKAPSTAQLLVIVGFAGKLVRAGGLAVLGRRFAAGEGDGRGEGGAGVGAPR